MEFNEAEKKANRLHNLRKDKAELTKKIDILVKDVKDYLKSQDRNSILFDNVSVSILVKKNRVVDYDAIESLIKKGVLPENTITFRESETLKTASQGDVKLEGNRWVTR